MRLFYLAAFGPTGREVVWDRMVVAADPEAAAFFARPYLPIGYTVGRIREMPLPPSVHVEGRELLGMPGTTVKEWWTIWASVQGADTTNAARHVVSLRVDASKLGLGLVKAWDLSLGEEEPS